MAIVVVAGSWSTGSRSVVPDLSSHSSASSGVVRAPAAASSSSAASGTPVPGPTATNAASGAGAAPSGSAASAPSGSAASGSVAFSPSGVAVAPAAGRQVIQGASLTLAARPAHVSDVARQVFVVIAAEHGFVDNSNVNSGGADAGAQFTLTVPSASLSQAMAALSDLHGASVVSRNDVSQDVTGRVGGAGRKLADARALRSALLRKLALALTTTAINSLRLQIRDVDASIASDLATLRGIKNQVANSQIQLTIGAAAPTPVTPAAHGGGFGIGRALHSAGRVLVVAAGVGLIALAVLVPIGLLAALGWWVAHVVVRRRRDQALDLV